MLDKLESLFIKFKQLEEKLSDPESTSDMDKFKALNKEYRNLEPIAEKYLEYKNLLSNIESNRDILTFNYLLDIVLYQGHVSLPQNHTKKSIDDEWG